MGLFNVVHTVFCNVHFVLEFGQFIYHLDKSVKGGWDLVRPPPVVILAQICFFYEPSFMDKYICFKYNLSGHEWFD